jgi:hypothetical protein
MRPANYQQKLLNYISKLNLLQFSFLQFQDFAVCLPVLAKRSVIFVNLKFKFRVSCMAN